MKKQIYTLLLSGLLATSLPATADFYAGIGFGESFNGGSATTNGVRSSYKNSKIYSLAGGYELPLPLFDVRGEVEYLHTKADVKFGKKRNFDGLMLNAYGVIPFVPVIDPYVGLGIGRVRYDHANAYAVQGILGAEYAVPVTAPITIGAEYRYLKINETTGKKLSPSKFHSNILMLKARYSF